jgi:para-aminobenzoate synthetase/4-amino-4-deoxychorismate lyase
MLFETSLFCGPEPKSYILIDPLDVIKITDFRGVKDAFDLIEKYSKRYFLAGYFSYELGYYFERPSFRTESVFTCPLIHLCVFENAVSFNHSSGAFSSCPEGLLGGSAGRKFRISRPRFDIPRPEYVRKISKLKKHIMDGDTYQANLTGKYVFDFSGDAYSFYLSLKERQNVPYGAFCKMDGESILSLSPELFFRRDGNKITSRPMKGTIKRGINAGEDRRLASELSRSSKEAAGNLMIVDLIRNDLGKICSTGSVKVSSLFEVERYDTLFQMTSTVTGTLRDQTAYYDIFKSIFPGGSVTGAPKIRTMQILNGLEKRRRGVYCGAMGIIFPGKKAVFNIPIRTVSLSNGKGEMGTGGGITVDSDAEEEYRECLLKAKFLTARHESFSLLETMLWDGKFIMLDAHLERMRRSALYFGFNMDRKKIRERLLRAGKGFKGPGRLKIRLLLPRDGNFSFEAGRIENEAGNRRRDIVVSRFRTDPGNVFLYHKTTNRKLYDSEHSHYRSQGYFDVIFVNNRGEVTEGAVSNIFILKEGKYYTPPVSSGLLPGVFRSHLLKILGAREKVLYVNDLKDADKIFLCNSVRGIITL